MGRFDDCGNPGRPATSKGVIVRVSTVEQIQDVMRFASESAIPVTVSAGRSNVTGAALPLRGDRAGCLRTQ